MVAGRQITVRIILQVSAGWFRARWSLEFRGFIVAEIAIFFKRNHILQENGLLGRRAIVERWTDAAWQDLDRTQDRDAIFLSRAS
jgi:hypothetical protein